MKEKEVKVIFMSAESSAIVCLAMFLWHLADQGTIEGLEALFCFVLAMTAVAFQKEQSSIDWEDDPEEESLSPAGNAEP